MNFYEAQDDARKQSFWLVCLFSLAVISLVLITNIVAGIFFYYSDIGNAVGSDQSVSTSGPIQFLSSVFYNLGWNKALWITGLVTGTIFIAMLFKWLSLRAGGRVVAENLGGILVQTNTRNPDEKKLLNVVEEMALASGVPVPPVYVLNRENSINAFAAGYSTKDAVIGVSRGSIEILNREQLQGVIAHEFSHILNGDMRLNLKIIAVLHGILMIGEMGQFFLDFGSTRSLLSTSRNRSKNGAGYLVFFGLALWVLGWLGYFFGALIKAGVSRQREYLADASAVQFTRNPDGIGDALKLIGGHTEHSFIRHSASHELSHMFFSQSFRGSWLATHPPLEKRIKQVLPKWDGKYLSPKAMFKAPVDPTKRVQSEAVSGFAGVAQTSLAEAVSEAPTIEVKEQVCEPTVLDPAYLLVPSEVKELAHEPLGAVGICLAMLVFDDESLRVKQFQIVTEKAPKWLPHIKSALKHTRELDSKTWLPAIEIAIPAIKSLSNPQYNTLKVLMTGLIRCDGQVALKEWVLFELVRQHGDRHFGISKDVRAKYKTISDVEPHYLIVLSRLIHYGTDVDMLKRKAFSLSSNTTGLYSSKLLDLEACSGAKFTRAIHELGKAYPMLKPRLMKGLVKAARADDKINPYEKMVVSVIALIWDCPVVGLEDDSTLI